MKIIEFYYSQFYYVLTVYKIFGTEIWDDNINCLILFKYLLTNTATPTLHFNFQWFNWPLINVINCVNYKTVALS